MKSVFLLLILAIYCVTARGQQYDSTYGKPLVVLVETNPWAMVIGSDVPSFALYENGQVIYKSIEDKKVKIYEAKLGKDELQKVIQSLGITDSVYKLRNEITASTWTDQPSNDLILNFDSTKFISVYGSLRSESEARKATPTSFLVVYDNIKKYRSESAREWLPAKIEVMFWGYDYAPEKRPWIPGFPDLNSSTTVKRDNDLYSVYIDGKDYETFKKYFSSMGEKQAVEINGKKMAMSFRLPFPNMK